MLAFDAGPTVVRFVSRGYVGSYFRALDQCARGPSFDGAATSVSSPRATHRS